MATYQALVVATYYANPAKYIEFAYYSMPFEDSTNYYSDPRASTTAYHVADSQSKGAYYVKKEALVATHMVDSL